MSWAAGLLQVLVLACCSSCVLSNKSLAQFWMRVFVVLHFWG